MNSSATSGDQQQIPGSDSQADVSFAETALKLGGKSDEEARRTGVIDKADDQVEQLFQPQYQTVNSPIHRAVWDRGVPVDLFQPAPVETTPEVTGVMDSSVELVQRHRQAGSLLTPAGKVSEELLAELGEVG